MPVATRWYDNARTIIIFEFDEQWTWEEYNAARQNCQHLMESVDYPVDHLYNLNAVQIMPDGSLRKFWNAAATKHKNASGLVVVVAQNRFLEMLTNSIKNVIQKTIRNFDISFVSDISQAEAQILQRRSHHRAQS